MRGWKVQGLSGNSYVQRLSTNVHVVAGELNPDELQLHRGLLRPRWTGVHSVRDRKVQELSGISCVQRVFGRDIFYNRRGHIKYDMPHVPIKFSCTAREQNLVQLHLQRRLQRAKWRSMHSVPSRRIQGVDGTRHMRTLQR